MIAQRLLKTNTAEKIRINSKIMCLIFFINYGMLMAYLKVSLVWC